MVHRDRTARQRKARKPDPACDKDVRLVVAQTEEEARRCSEGASYNQECIQQLVEKQNSASEAVFNLPNTQASGKTEACHQSATAGPYFGRTTRLENRSSMLIFSIKLCSEFSFRMYPATFFL